MEACTELYAEPIEFFQSYIITPPATSALTTEL